MNKNEFIEMAVVDLNGDFDNVVVPERYFMQLNNDTAKRESVRFAFTGIEATREEFNAAADRMRGKPDWDSAPDWACWLAQSNDGKWHWYPYYVDEPTQGVGCFLNKSRDCCIIAARGKLIGDWRNTLEKRPERKPQPAPAKPWFEAGELPLAGTVCEYKFQNPKYSWQPVTVNYISNLHAILTCHLDGDEVHTDGYTAADFRQIKTEKEKFIETALAKFDEISDQFPPAGNEWLTKLFGQMFDAGFKVPDQK